MPVSSNGWQSLLDQLNTSGSFYRLKEGATRLRLVPLPGMDYTEAGFQFWAEAETFFNGQSRTKYVIPALVIDGKGARPEMSTTITPVILPKKALTGILSLLAEGYDLFGPEGFGVTIKRTGSSLDTEYFVMASKSAVPVDGEAITVPEQTIEEMAEAYAKWANRPSGRGAQSDDEDDSFVEEPQPLQRRSRGNRRNTGGDGSADW